MKTNLLLAIIAIPLLITSCGDTESKEEQQDIEQVKEEKPAYPADSIAIWEQTALGGIDFLINEKTGKQKIKAFKEACTVPTNEGRTTSLKLGAWHFDGIEAKYYLDSLYEVTLYSEVRMPMGNGYSGEAAMSDVKDILNLLTKKYGAPKPFQVLDQVLPKRMTSRELYYWPIGEKRISIEVSARSFSASAPPYVELTFSRSDYSRLAFEKSQREYEEKRAAEKKKEEQAVDML